MEQEIHARLVINGTFDPEDITRRLNAQPRISFRKGEKTRIVTRPRPCDGWISHWAEGDGKTLDSYLVRLLDDYDEDVLLALRRELGIQIEYAMAIFTGPDNFGVHFDLDTLKRVVRLGAEIDLDIYAGPEPHIPGSCTGR